jgi:hypothetical protein
VASVADATQGMGSITGQLTARRGSMTGSQIVSLVLTLGQGGVPDGNEIEHDVIMALDIEPDRIKVKFMTVKTSSQPPTLGMK